MHIVSTDGQFRLPRVATWAAIWLALAAITSPAAEPTAADEVTLELGSTSKPTLFIARLPLKELKFLRGDAAAGQHWPSVLSVIVVRDRESDPLAMLGEYQLQGDRLSFAPRFPLRPGVTYRATYFMQALANRTVTREFTIPKLPASQPTAVDQVFPTRGVLPENQLKFYIHFSAPMSRGQAYRHIRLVTNSGTQIEDPFLELGEELWNRDGTRFTLFFDPGRIKRGLKPREEVGPALEEGKRYTLEIDLGWKDARGRPLIEPFRKSFRVVAPDDSQPRLDQWKIETPAAGTSDPLIVRFDEPLDHAMLYRVLVVNDPSGTAMPGEVKVGDGEARWEFYPSGTWVAGAYQLVIDRSLEDLAGNNLARPFEVDVFRPLPNSSDAQHAVIPFRINPPATSPR